MAHLGFYDIRTFESLSRELINKPYNYKSIYNDKPVKEVEEVKTEGSKEMKPMKK